MLKEWNCSISTICHAKNTLVSKFNIDLTIESIKVMLMQKMVNLFINKYQHTCLTLSLEDTDEPGDQKRFIVKRWPLHRSISLVCRERELGRPGNHGVPSALHSSRCAICSIFNFEEKKWNVLAFFPRRSSEEHATRFIDVRCRRKS